MDNYDNNNTMALELYMDFTLVSTSYQKLLSLRDKREVVLKKRRSQIHSLSKDVKLRRSQKTMLTTMVNTVNTRPEY